MSGDETQITTRIGMIAARWARFEYIVTEIIWHLANVDIEAGACITAQIQSPSSRLRALAALVRLRGGSPELYNTINSFTVDCDSLARQRNRYIHDPWLSGEDMNPRRVEITADRKLRFEAVETSLEEMDALSAKIRKAIDDLQDLYARIRRELSWPDTQWRQSLDKDPTLAHLGQGSGS
jgi:hypothetical protein